ncbi:SDR family oxidoreductase, partial [Nocardia mangyaensis]|uniref:SDR family oxidoreductase n=1 Tax=Nocardia mangyaensis TaxID=2213200 RepID=UPI0026751CC5
IKEDYEAQEDAEASVVGLAVRLAAHAASPDERLYAAQLLLKAAQTSWSRFAEEETLGVLRTLRTQIDALDEQAVEKHIGDVAKKAGDIDLLFNAIGMEDIQGTPLLDLSLADFAHPVIIATRTQFLTGRAVARHMVKQGAGVILTITSVPDPEGTPNVGGFDVACAAVEGLWRSFAAELGP